MKIRNKWKGIIGILLLIIISGLIVYPRSTGWERLDQYLKKLTIKQGLDLKGGVHLVYEADVSEVEKGREMESLKGAQDVIERRVNAFGVAEPVIRAAKVGDKYRLIVELAGLTDIDKAKELIKETPLLEFKEEGEVKEKLTPEEEKLVADLAQEYYQKLSDEEKKKMSLEQIKQLLTEKMLQPQWKPTGLTGKHLERAQVAFNPQTGQPVVAIKFNKEGKELFKKITEKNKGKQVAIFLDKQIISAPVVQTVIRDGQAEITGKFTLAEAKKLAQRLNAGALPVPIKLVEERRVEATLGAESLRKSLRAALWGLGLVAIFMIIYYRLAGLVAVISLMIYASLMVAIIKLSSLTPYGITLTLPGIAGFILSVGMAVDANILIFERIKEELKAGRSLAGAIKEGFRRAWPSIRDGNYSTILTSLILIIFGSGFVQGFALILVLGVLLSMFTAIVITRILMRLLENRWLEKHKRLVV